MNISVTAGALFSTVTNASQALAAALVVGKVYQFASSTNCWIKQGHEAQTADLAANNIFCPAGVPFLLHGSHGAHVSVIRNTADGHCTLHAIDSI